MASTPSASALSAVLRCRGNIWSRNPSAKRPATSAYSLGLAGGALRDSALGRSGSEQETVWERLSLKERVVPGGRLTVACRTSGRLREKHSEGGNKCFPKLPPSQGPRSAAAGPPNTLCQLSSNLSAGDKSSGITDVIKNQTCADPRVFKVVFVRDRSVSAAGALEQKAGRIPGFVLSGWSALKTSCWSLTALMSRIVSGRLALICGSGGARRHLLRKEESAKPEELQVSPVKRVWSSSVSVLLQDKLKTCLCPLTGSWTNPHLLRGQLWTKDHTGQARLRRPKASA